MAAPAESSGEDRLSPDELRDAWPLLATPDRVEALAKELPRDEAEDFFFALPARDQAEVVLGLPPAERRSWMRLLAPDDAADLAQEAPAGARESLLALLDEPTRKEVTALMAYAEDDAGGLMNPRFARVRPDMSVDEAIGYLRRQARQALESMHYVYVLDAEQRLRGALSVRELFAASADKQVRDVMHADLVTAPAEMDQEALAVLFAQNDLVAIPVVDAQARMKGIVTVDDIVDVVQEEATEDIQKMGGTEALEEPYLEARMTEVVRKRATWLAVLLVGEMLTATAMAFFEKEIARAVVLVLFIPLIISAGGNAGSQATTLVIRAMALGEVRLRDWWRVMRREILAGLLLGAILGAIGFLRIEVWEALTHVYGTHHVRVAWTVAASLLGVVMWGAVAGSMLPFALRRAGFDPASASAPFVATLVDVVGVVLYFTVASLILAGTLL